MNFEASPSKQLMKRQFKASAAAAVPAAASPFDYGTLLLCLERLNLFDSYPQLKLQQVCRDLRYKFLEHVTRLGIARFQPLCPEFVYKPPNPIYTSVLFQQSNFEDAAIRFAQLCPGSSVGVIFGALGLLPAAQRCGTVLREQLRRIARSNNIHAWNRLLSLAFSNQQCYGDVILGPFYFELVHDILTADCSLIFMDLCRVLFSQRDRVMPDPKLPQDYVNTLALPKFPSTVAWIPGMPPGMPRLLPSVDLNYPRTPLTKCPVKTLSLLAACETKLNCWPHQFKCLLHLFSTCIWPSVSNNFQFKVAGSALKFWNAVWPLHWINNSVTYLLKHADIALIQTGFLDRIVLELTRDFRIACNPQDIQHAAVLQALTARL